MIQAIAGLITNGITAYTERSKQKAHLKNLELSGEYRLKQAQIDSQIKRVEDGDNAAISLDQLSFQHRGWKDEYLLLFTTAPVLILFLAPLVDLILLGDSYQAGALSAAVIAGFTALNQTPDWYLVALGLVFVDTLGFRRLLRGFIENKLGQLSGKK
ncbi:hypothetical protein [uncultured Endozoicomonas sp.]|uniref:hypothetical protein n=1 Tax=uncultured Endozoicomonas sp. TaxID=432652 RepID=UPI00261556A7|nr:hypothetical protein [uncultured Endozoicomonas sp.]